MEPEYLALLGPSQEPMTLLEYAGGVEWADAQEQDPVERPISHLWDEPWQWEDERVMVNVDRLYHHYTPETPEAPHVYRVVVTPRSNTDNWSINHAPTMPEIITFLNEWIPGVDFNTVAGRVFSEHEEEQ